MKDLQDVSETSSLLVARPNALRRLFRSLWEFLERARTRRLLSQLDGRDLADLGLSHADRLHELDKPFWR
ncbi:MULTISPECIES: DUF1127 domain-containing protein [unclassified Pseudomonas]|jgi:uncharacterized protein YjiS (DUF1127 family)|uniref:DUF1127 domain-containing protein n=1 Tax=unclassified Pseudomonas TaxID=196821 RepID=UPI00131FC752|nr:DUF1127 domain-containing protein [Pseudomonas sp. R84]QHC93197.1 hypothetical protein PspR84_00640 [Pseudomonas sp. R84]